MTGSALPSAKQLGVAVRLWEIVLALPAVAVMLFFVEVLLEFSATDWQNFLLAVAGLATVSSIVTTRPRTRALAPMVAFLAQGGAEGAVEPATARAAFRAAIGLPRRFFVLGLAGWASVGASVPLCLALLDVLPRGGYGAFVILVAAASGGLISSVLSFFVLKRVVEPVREAAAGCVRDPDERAALVVRVGLRSKLLWVAATSSIVSITFAVLLALGQATAPLERMAQGWQERTLARVAASLDGGRDESLLGELHVDPAFLPAPMELRLFDPTADRSVPGIADELLETLAARVHEGASTAAAVDLGDGRLTGWRQLGDGRVAIMRIPAHLVNVDLARTQAVFAVVFVFAILLAATLALLLAEDLRRETSLLRAEVQRMASGDLRPGRVCESEDELGALARSFETMGGALRATVGRVSEAADRVDGATSQLSGGSQVVAAASADQVQALQQVGDSMDQISQRVTGLADASQVLNESVEEASSSILELGASGEELNDTASVLSEKVEEVSSSIEEIMRSMKQVTSNAEGLSQAAEETSSSMEEMASAMRAVDQTAAETARLSSQVVESAEHGREKVRQTIEGMDEIRVATEVAEDVIRNLGGRAKEIGAIVDVIDDVADETNLLALNAAIIAAQAGEHGRAFSVVADEIKELADRVLASTKEIGALIRSVQEETENAIGAVESGARSVASGVELSAEAGVSLEQITRSSRDSGQRIAEIVSAVREQTRAAAHVAELMERVRGGVEQIRAAGVEQERGHEIVFRSSVAMREVAQQVRHTTEEQARGGARIRDSIEQVRETVEGMNRALQDQSGACRTVRESTEQLLSRTRNNEEAARQMDEAVKALATQAEALREDVRRFRIGEERAAGEAE